MLCLKQFTHKFGIDSENVVVMYYFMVFFQKKKILSSLCVNDTANAGGINALAI